MVAVKTHSNRRAQALGMKAKIGILTILSVFVLFCLTFSSCSSCKNKAEGRNNKTKEITARTKIDEASKPMSYFFTVVAVANALHTETLKGVNRCKENDRERKKKTHELSAMLVDIYNARKNAVESLKNGNYAEYNTNRNEAENCYTNYNKKMKIPLDGVCVNDEFAAEIEWIRRIDKAGKEALDEWQTGLLVAWDNLHPLIAPVDKLWDELIKAVDADPTRPKDIEK
jgi:hypothetical protein